jgi:hypothetical protein
MELCHEMVGTVQRLRFRLCFVAARLQLVEERSELLVIEFYPR